MACLCTHCPTLPGEVEHVSDMVKSKEVKHYPNAEAKYVWVASHGGASSEYLRHSDEIEGTDQMSI